MSKHLTASKFMLFLIIWFIAVQLVMSVVLVSLENSRGLDIDAVVASPWYIVAIQLAALLLPLFIWIAIKKDSFKANMPNWSLGGKNIAIIVALSFLLQPAMMLVSGISSLFFTNYVSEMIYSFMEYPLWLILLATAVTPAVCEELVFRGYIQTQHKDRTIKQAAILNGLFFAIIHLNMQQFAYAFVMGVIFVYMVHYTRSIWAGIFPHFIVNATQGILGRWAFSTDFFDEAPYLYAEELPLDGVNSDLAGVIVLGVIVLLLSPVIYMLFRSFVRHNRWRVESEHVNQPTDDTSPLTDTRPAFFDRFTVAVIAIFIGFVVLISFI